MIPRCAAKQTVFGSCWSMAPPCNVLKAPFPFIQYAIEVRTKNTSGTGSIEPVTLEYPLKQHTLALSELVSQFSFGAHLLLRITNSRATSNNSRLDFALNLLRCSVLTSQLEGIGFTGADPAGMICERQSCQSPHSH